MITLVTVNVALQCFAIVMLVKAHRSARAWRMERTKDHDDLLVLLEADVRRNRQVTERIAETLDVPSQIAESP